MSSLPPDPPFWEATVEVPLWAFLLIVMSTVFQVVSIVSLVHQ